MQQGQSEGDEMLIHENLDECKDGQRDKEKRRVKNLWCVGQDLIDRHTMNLSVVCTSSVGLRSVFSPMNQQILINYLPRKPVEISAKDRVMHFVATQHNLVNLNWTGNHRLEAISMTKSGLRNRHRHRLCHRLLKNANLLWFKLLNRNQLKLRLKLRLKLKLNRKTSNENGKMWKEFRYHVDVDDEGWKSCLTEDQKTFGVWWMMYIYICYHRIYRIIVV